jgi:hypothetical protein
MEKFASTVEAEVETIRVSEPKFASAPYQGVTAVTSMKVTRHAELRHVPAGALWIPADQPDFEVAVQLLEPDAADSLMAWGLMSTIFERKEWIDGPELERIATEMLKDSKVKAQWEKALADPTFAKDAAARYEWWSRRTPYWDESIGLMPVYRAMKVLK